MDRTKLDPLTRRRVSVAADGTHEQTIDSYIAGRDVRAASRLRIERALRELGLDHLVRRDLASLSTVPAAMASRASRR